MPSLVVIGPRIKEKQRGALCPLCTLCPPPAYMVPKDPSLNRVKTAGSLFIYKNDNDVSPHFFFF